MAVFTTSAILGGLGKGLLGLGKGLSKGMTAGKVMKTGAKIIAANKISAPRQQDTSKTISPSYYEEPKKQSVFKRTTSDGSIESVKITVTNIKSVLFKKQKQLAKRRKHNVDLERRFSDLENKRSVGGKIGKGFGKVLSPFSNIMSGIASAIPLMIASILANALLSDEKGGLGAALTKTETDKKVDKSVEEVGKEKTLNLLNQEQEDKKKKGNRFTRWFNRVIRGEGAEYKKQEERVKTGETPRYGFFGQIKDKGKLESLNDTSLIDNDNEVTNTIIINRPIEVPAK